MCGLYKDRYSANFAYMLSPVQVFQEQSSLVGPSAALFENMAHTYNSIGDYDNAEKYFLMAMDLVDQFNKGKKGGILLGLGLVHERKGAPREALPFLQNALATYKVCVLMTSRRCVCW